MVRVEGFRSSNESKSGEDTASTAPISISISPGGQGGTSASCDAPRVSGLLPAASMVIKYSCKLLEDSHGSTEWGSIGLSTAVPAS